MANPDKVFLISPFDKLANVIKDKYPIYPINLLLKDKYDNYEMYYKFNKSIIIFHGDKDFLISDKLSYSLYESINTEDKKYIIEEEKGHNDMYSYELFNQILDFIINTTK